MLSSFYTRRNWRTKWLTKGQTQVTGWHSNPVTDFRDTVLCNSAHGSPASASVISSGMVVKTKTSAFPRISESVGLVRGLRVCISNNVSCNSDAAGSCIALGESLHHATYTSPCLPVFSLHNFVLKSSFCRKKITRSKWVIGIEILQMAWKQHFEINERSFGIPQTRHTLLVLTLHLPLFQ